MSDLVIRETTAADIAEVEAVHATAFGDHAVMVVPLLRSLMNLPPSPYALSLAATVDDRVVGHAMFSRSILDAPKRLVDVSVLSPLAVHPDVQGQGIGTRLVATGLEMLAARNVPAVFLEGSPDYYGARGFRGGLSLGFIRPSVRIPEAGFQVALLPAYEEWMTGALVYNQVFWDHDAAGLRD